MIKFYKSKVGFSASIIVISMVMIAVAAYSGWYFWQMRNENKSTKSITTFEECAAAGNPIQESYPEVCVTKEGQRFVNPTQSLEN